MNFNIVTIVYKELYCIIFKMKITIKILLFEK